MNSNGIREWLAQAGRSKYRMPRMFWWTWLAIGLGIVIGMLIGPPAHASSGCMTLHQARHAHPDRHLWWSPDGDGGRCWTTVSGGRHVAARHRKIHSSGGGVESRNTERQADDRLHSAGREKPQRSDDRPLLDLRQVGAEVQAGPQSPKSASVGVASDPPETKEAPSASMIEAAAAALGPPATVLPSIRVGAIFADRWPTQPAISPLRWSRELVEFGSAAP